MDEAGNANRSFLAILAVTLPFGAFVICGALANVLVPLILKRASLDGPASLPPLSVLSFVVLVALGLGLAGRSLARQAVASRRLTRRVRALARTAPEKLVQAARQAGLGNRVDLVDRPEAFCSCTEASAPRVTVSRGLLESVHAAELRAASFSTSATTYPTSTRSRSRCFSLHDGLLLAAGTWLPASAMSPAAS